MRVRQLVVVAVQIIVKIVVVIAAHRTQPASAPEAVDYDLRQLWGELVVMVVVRAVPNRQFYGLKNGTRTDLVKSHTPKGVERLHRVVQERYPKVDPHDGVEHPQYVDLHLHFVPLARGVLAERVVLHHLLEAPKNLCRKVDRDTIPIRVDVVILGRHNRRQCGDQGRAYDHECAHSGRRVGPLPKDDPGW